MKIYLLVIPILFYCSVLDGQEEAFSKDELKFKAGNEALLNGDPHEALEIFEHEIFENSNYDAVPYYKTAYCAVPKDEAPALKKIKKATKLAKKAGNHWGASHDEGQFKKGFDLIKTKADNGNAIAQLSLATAYQCGCGVKKNKQLAAEYLTMAADQGLSCAVYGLGIYYAKGIGVEKDLDKAIELVEMSITPNARKSRLKYLEKLKKKVK